MNYNMENMKQQIEEIIKKNLPDKKEAGLYTTSKATGGDIINYNREDNDDKREGFNQAISQIPISLIADGVLKVIRKSLPKKYPHSNEKLTDQLFGYNQAINDIEKLLDNLSPNKENKNNERNV